MRWRINHPSPFYLAGLCLTIAGQRLKWDTPAVVPSTSPRPTSPWRIPATSSSPTGALRPTIWRRAQKWNGSAGWRPWNWPRRRLWRCWQNPVGNREHHVWGASCLPLLGTYLFDPSLSVNYHPSDWVRLLLIMQYFSRRGGFHLGAVLPCGGHHTVSGDVSVVVAEGCWYLDIHWVEAGKATRGSPHNKQLAGPKYQ